jgi:Protein of unknown function (DUF3300)
MGAGPIGVIARLFALTVLLAPSSVWAQTGPPPAPTPAPAETETALPAAQIPVPAPQAESPAAEMPLPRPAPLLQAEQLDQLLSPIALYPDALLAQILMAATYPLEVVKANRWSLDPRHAALSGDQLAAAVEAETWDPSVKALAAFPQILRMMDANLDWTEQLGDAILAQQPEVMDAIQRLRQQAAAAGTLWSNAEQNVTEEGQGIAIEPVNPAYIYPPLYNPAVVYGPWPSPEYPPLDIVPPDYAPSFALPFGIGFGAGFAVVQPLWCRCAFDWTQRQIRFHADKGNPERIDAGVRWARWQHDPAHRRGMPHLAPANSRKAFAVIGARPVPAVALPHVAVSKVVSGPPPVLSRSFPRAFLATRLASIAHIAPERGVAGRPVMIPHMTPWQPAGSPMPRSVAVSSAGPAGGGWHVHGLSRR